MTRKRIRKHKKRRSFGPQSQTGYGIDIKRDDEILALYKRGLSLQQIGNKFDITRSRTQQIVYRILKRNILADLRSHKFQNPDKKPIKVLVGEEMERIRKKKRVHWLERKLTEKAKEGIIPEKFSSELKFANAIKVNIGVIREFAPDVTETIRNNKTLGMGGRRWSKFYLRCRRCGTTSKPHHSIGLCQECYHKSEHFKSILYGSRLRNYEKWKPRIKEYLKEYHRRPEVKKKMELKRKEYYSRPEVKAKMREKSKKIHDRRFFGGNREKAIQNGGYKCAKCGRTREENKKLFGKDLNVIHINGLDNSLENLMPLCKECFQIELRNRRSREKI